VDDVQAARSARDAAWRQSCAAPAEVQHQRQVELAMRQADTLADALLRDAGRSAALHALQRQIADLDRDQHLRQAEITHLQDEQRRRDAAWRTRLYQAGLPDAAPASLREWQARLRVARQAADAREALDREAERTAQRVADLSQGLREALKALAPAQPVPQGPLATLLALARHCEAHHAQTEQAAQAHAHAQQQRRETHVQLQREADRLLAARTAAAQAVAEMGRALQLPPGADAVAVRARLQEWADVRAVAERHALAMHAHAQAERTLADLRDKAHALAGTLDLPLPLGADLRHWIDTLARTLSEARAQDSQRQVLAQTLTDTRERAAQHTTVLAQIGRDLQGLCDAAGVGAAEALPEAEARARMHREALQRRDQLRQTLAAVSTEDEAHLRQLVAGDIGDQDQDQDHSQAQAALREIEQALAVLAPQVEAARQHDEAARRARDAIDAGDAAAQARAAMEQSAATVRASLGPWQRARLAQALLAQALAQFRERAQGPMLRAASDYFASMTAGDYDHLHSEPAEDADHAVLRIRRRDGRHLGVDGLSEGTRDQLYLALRLAALQRHRARGIALPLVLDDVLMTSDDDRAVHLLRTLADFAQGGQVLVFTHHRHLLALAQQHLPASLLACSTL
jgi:DNA repair protein SbcC/Rad50